MNPVIAESPKEAKLEQLWEELVGKSPKAEDFLHLARMVPYLRQRAWDKYVETNPSEAELRGMLSGPYAYEYSHIKPLVGTALVEKYPTPNTLLLVMQMVPGLELMVASVLVAQEPSVHEVWDHAVSRVSNPSLRGQLARKLLTITLPNSILCNIMTHVPVLGVVAGERLLRQNPEGHQLVTVLATVPSLASRAWEVLSREGNNNVLTGVVVSVPDYRTEAARLLLAREFKPNGVFNPMFHIAKHVPELREEVWERLSVVTLSNTQLEAIAREVPELSARALALRKPEERSRETIMGEIFTANDLG